MPTAKRRTSATSRELPVPFTTIPANAPVIPHRIVLPVQFGSPTYRLIQGLCAAQLRDKRGRVLYQPHAALAHFLDSVAIAALAGESDGAPDD